MAAARGDVPVLAGLSRSRRRPRSGAHPFLCEPPRARIYLGLPAYRRWYSYQRVGNSEFRFKPRRLAVTESQSSPKRSLSDLEKRGRSFDHFLVFGPREKDFECPGARGHVGSPWVDRGVRPWHFPHKLEGGHCIFAHIGQLQTCLTKSPHNCTFCTKGRVFGTLIILPAPLRGPSVPA